MTDWSCNTQDDCIHARHILPCRLCFLCSYTSFSCFTSELAFVSVSSLVLPALWVNWPLLGLLVHLFPFIVCVFFHCLPTYWLVHCEFFQNFLLSDFLWTGQCLYFRSSLFASSFGLFALPWFNTCLLNSDRIWLWTSLFYGYALVSCASSAHYSVSTCCEYLHELISIHKSIS